jgi:hypothetical protein
MRSRIAGHAPPQGAERVSSSVTKGQANSIAVAINS